MPRLSLAALTLTLAPCLSLAGCEGGRDPELLVVDRATGAAIDGATVRVEGGWVHAEAPGYLSMRRAVGARELRLFPAAPSSDAERALLEDGAPQDRDLSGDLRPAARALIEAIRSAPDAPTIAELVPRPPGTAAALAPPPETIRVWRRRLDGSTASCAGRVDVIPFEQYVKGVLPHEWIPSWDARSLEMGAVAIRTYAWWWIEAGGKYDCADLDDTTASQVYEDEFLPKTDLAVDATAGVAIVRDGSLVFAEYSAENGDPTEYGVDEPHCAGQAVFGHGRGTCQWGTQRWAVNEGRDFVWMAAHYYPGAEASLPAPAYEASFSGETYPTVMTSGEEAVVWLEYRNDGGATWDTEHTRIATSEPRDRDSPFYLPGNWIAPNRPSAADHSDYGPGSVGRFSFVLLAPEVDVETTFVEHFALVQEGVTWFGPEDAAVTWTITVKPRATNDPGSHPFDPGDKTQGGSDLVGGCAVATPGSSRRTPASRLALMGILAAFVLRRGKKWALLAAATSCLALVGCTRDGAPPPAEREVRVALGGDSPLIPVFHAAADEHGVPAELLATVAFVETRLRMRLDRDGAHGAPQWGIMALGAHDASSLERAASLLGEDPLRVRDDLETNVRGAAAILAEEGAGSPMRSLADWSPALRAYGGEALADEVLWRIERGWRGLDDDRRWLVVTARSVGGATGGGDVGSRSFALGYPGAIWNPANAGNYQAASRGAAQINYVVIHTVQGSYAGCISWFQNPASNVSAHYVVRSSDGQITQMVDDSDVAWHDACFNSETIGIEHEGFVDDPDTWYTEPMYAASAALTAWICDQYGIPKDRDHIMGHGEAPDCSDHTDPGGGWDWAHYLELVNSGGVSTYEADEGGKEHPAEMTSGDEAVAWFEFVNHGNVTWGLDETRLGTQDPQDRDSPFFVEGNWLSPSRATGADHSNYGPGSTGRFTFAIRAPEVDRETTYIETFQLVQEGVTWFGPRVTMTITVHPRVAPPPPVDPLDPVDPGVTPEEGDDGASGITGGCAVGGRVRGAAPFALLAGCAILGAGVLRRRRSRQG